MSGGNAAAGSGSAPPSQQVGWQRTSFCIATLTGSVTLDGFTYRGLGLDKRGRWILSHLNTGLKIAALGTQKPAALAAATEIAEAGDWEFSGPDGIENQFPDAGAIVHEILLRHGFAGIGKRSEITEPIREICRDVLTKRESPSSPSVSA